MGQITVRAETTVLGMKLGEKLTVEDTPFLRNVINGGRLSLVDSTCADTAASTASPAPDAAPLVDPPPGESATKAKRTRGGASPPAAQLADVVDVRPPADPDGPRLTVRAPDLPPAA